MAGTLQSIFLLIATTLLPPLSHSIALLDPCPGELLDVTTFSSPDHSVKPYVEAIKSAQRTIDMLVPGRHLGTRETK